ncbi:zinc finger protein 853-like [Brachyistius frenatus]|uniref:zinc finger protein 853-like n=1 Tax=Brachyistius frenatus TaxID=100188 RepID=UPI0037E8131F
MGDHTYYLGEEKIKGRESSSLKKQEHEEAKRSRDRRRQRTRVNIGVAFPRWRSLLRDRCFHTDAEVACFLLDCHARGRAFSTPARGTPFQVRAPSESSVGASSGTDSLHDTSVVEEDTEGDVFNDPENSAAEWADGGSPYSRRGDEEADDGSDEERLPPVRTPFVADVPQQRVCKEEEFLSDHQFCNQQRNSSLDQEELEPPQMKEEQEELEPPQIKEEQEEPDPPQIKEDQEELCTSQEGEQLELKQETESVMVTPADEESNHSEPEPNGDQFFSHNSPVAESRDRRGSRHEDSGSTGNAELKPKKRRQSNNEDDSSVSDTLRNADIGKQSLKCDFCGQLFKYESESGRRHHTGEESFACETCGKRFYRIYLMKYHRSTHTGEKP